MNLFSFRFSVFFSIPYYVDITRSYNVTVCELNGNKWNILYALNAVYRLRLTRICLSKHFY